MVSRSGIFNSAGVCYTSRSASAFDDEAQLLSLLHHAPRSLHAGMVAQNNDESGRQSPHPETVQVSLSVGPSQHTQNFGANISTACNPQSTNFNGSSSSSELICQDCLNDTAAESGALLVLTTAHSMILLSCRMLLRATIYLDVLMLNQVTEMLRDWK